MKQHFYSSPEHLSLKPVSSQQSETISLSVPNFSPLERSKKWLINIAAAVLFR